MRRTITIQTPGRGMIEVTGKVREVVRASGISEGLCHVFIPHTSASLVIQENADRSARRDLEAFFERIAPDGDPAYEHRSEGPDDMPSHVRSALTRTSETIIVAANDLLLGTWQGIFLFEHRRAPHRRILEIMVMGDR